METNDKTIRQNRQAASQEVLKSPFLDASNDIAFRKIFGTEEQKECLISFLNAILRLEGDRRVVDLTYLPSLEAPAIDGLKYNLLDVRCTDSLGRQHIVEMQIDPAYFSDQRVLFYSSHAYTTQLQEGAEYDTLRPVIFLGILDFSFTKRPEVVSRHYITEESTQERAIKDFEFIFIELGKFKKTAEELTSLEDQWFFFFKHPRGLQEIPDGVTDPSIRKAFSLLKRHNWTQEELDKYVGAWMVRCNQKKALASAREEGLAEGQKQAVRETAKKMKDEGVPTPTISRCTGLTEGEIKRL